MLSDRRKSEIYNIPDGIAILAGTGILLQVLLFVIELLMPEQMPLVICVSGHYDTRQNVLWLDLMRQLT